MPESNETEGVPMVLLIVSWILCASTLMRVLSLFTSAFWVHTRGEEFATLIRAAPQIVRYDTEYLWRQIQLLHGGVRPWRPFGIRSQLLQVNAKKAAHGGKPFLAVLLGLVRFAWLWQIWVCLLSGFIIYCALFEVKQGDRLTIPLNAIVMLLLAGSISVAWEARAASGTMGGWAWVYHRYPGRRHTVQAPEFNDQATSWADTRVVIASSLVALVTIAQAQIWAAYVLSPSRHQSFGQVLTGPLLAAFGQSGIDAGTSWLTAVISLEVLLVAVGYVFFVVPLARAK